MRLKTKGSGEMGNLPRTSRQFFLSRFSVALLGLGLLAQIAEANAALAQSQDSSTTDAQPEKPKTDPAVMSVAVVDSNDKTVTNAKVEIRLWTGDWLKTKFNGTSDKNGPVEFEGVTPDRYSTVLVTHPDFASSMQDFTISAGETRTITCKLFPSVQGSIQIRSPDGKLVKGAEISRMEISSPGASSKTFLSCDMLPMITGKPKSEFRSDESGRLQLPPLPVGSSAKITVVHPDWSSNETAEIEITAGQITTLMLKPGTHVTLKLYGQPDVLADLDEKEITINTFTNSGFKVQKDSRLIHKFTCENNELKFTIPPGQYDAFYVRLAEDILITPELGSSPTVSTFNDFRAENVFKNCVVRKKVEFRGRVVTDSGAPVAGATMMVRTQNLFADADGNQKQLDVFAWTSCDVVETDAQGYFSAKAPIGKIKIDSQWSQYYSEQEVFECENDGVKQIPDFVVRPFPTLKGIVSDDSDTPIASAVVRILSASGSEYAVTDKDGKFSTQIVRFDYDPETKKRKFKATLLAFNPKNDQAGLFTVGIKDPKEFRNIKIKLKPRSSNWISQILAKQNEKTIANYSDETKAWIKKFDKESVKNFSIGFPGNPAPELNGGTWLNTNAKSLEDFRGKFVLLDFWFIGCGPCERDMPNLKLAQDLFGDQDFTVLSVHISTQTPENVQQFADARKMNYPLVVDSPSEEILNAYKKAGVSGFPSYILVGPDGKIVANDQVGTRGQKPSPPLSSNKLEAIYSAIRSKKQN
ncbi:MAG: redoxin family protein [Mariniblastus sp.]